jgi:hypothetical protein
MRVLFVSLSALSLVATLTSGCDITTLNPVACKLRAASFCGAGMYCDQTRNACMPSSADGGASYGDGGTYSGGDGFVPSCTGQFCIVVPPSQSSDLKGIYGSRPTDVWAVGNAGTTLHWDGKTWQIVPSHTTADLHGVWGTTAKNFFAVGDGGLILHWDGTAWTPQTSSTQVRLNAVSGIQTDAVWAVGDSGTILYSTDGTTWKAKPSPHANNLYGAWEGSSAGVQTLYSVGGSSDIIESSTAFPKSSADSNTGSLSLALYAVSGVSLSAHWAVGQAGQMTQSNGSINTPKTPVTSSDLLGITLYNFAQSYAGLAVGAGGTVISMDQNQQWTLAPSGTTATLYAVWSSSSEDVWIVGAGGIILHWPGMPL